MRKQNNYTSPAVFRRISLELESPILAGSLVDDTSVSTGGQETGGFIDGSGSSFNHDWE